MDSLPIQPYDIAMLAVIVLATLFGLWKGMAWQLASLGSLVASSIVAMRLSGPVAPYISSHEPWNRFIAMLVLFLATSLAIWLAFRLVAGAIDRVRLKEFDRQMGALFGLAKGCLLCLVITFFAVTLSETARQAVLKSRSGKYIALAIRKATPVMPREVRDVLGKYIDQLDQGLDPNTPPGALPLQRTADVDSTRRVPTTGGPPAAPGADEPLAEQIKVDIGQRVKGRLDQHVTEGLKGLDQRWDSLKTNVTSKVDEGLSAVDSEVGTRLDQGLESLDFSRLLVEPAGTSTLVALPSYRVGPSDVLKIRQTAPTASGGQAIDGLYRVERDGSLDLGRFGKVRAAGERLADVEHQIERHLAGELPGADVSLSVAAAESEVYYVIGGGAGEGANVWRLRATGNETIEDAIRGAGNAVEGIDKIWLVHPPAWGTSPGQLVPIEWDAARGRAAPNYRIAPGDAVFVSRTGSPWAAHAQDWVAAWLQWLRR